MHLVDYIATTNRFDVSMVDGLFERVLNHLKVKAGDMVFVGDRTLRDIVPAMACGSYTIQYSEVENVSLESSPVRINTLDMLEHILPS